MNIQQVTLALADASANNIAASQTPSSAGDLTLTAGALAGTVPQQARRILFTPAGAEAGNGTVWTVYGTNATGNVISESVAGVDNPTTAYTQQDFRTVTRIAVNKAQAGAVTVGTNGVASTPWFSVNTMTTPINIGCGVVVSGTINFTVEVTYDDFTSTAIPTAFPVTALATKTGNTDAAITTPCRGVRLTQNSFSSGGTAQATFIQAGIG